MFQRNTQRETTTYEFDKEMRDQQIPAIVVKCVSAIEKQGKSVKGIYRISGVKSSVEKLCHSFESEPDFVDLCDTPPNVTANVLKLYFRQLPEPLLTFHLYTDFIRIAKKYPTSRYSENVSAKDERQIIDDLKEVVAKLPRINYKTLNFLMHHLYRISRSPANNMPATNLGIVFGPTLLRTKEDDCALRTLVDTIYQTRVIELLITYAVQVFGEENNEETNNGTSNGTGDEFDIETNRPKHVYATQNVITLAGQKVVTSSPTTTPTKQSLYELRRQFFATPCSPPQFRYIPNSPPIISPLITSNGSNNNNIATNAFQLSNNANKTQLSSPSQIMQATKSIAQELRPTTTAAMYTKT